MRYMLILCTVAVHITGIASFQPRTIATSTAAAAVPVVCLRSSSRVVYSIAVISIAASLHEHSTGHTQALIVA
jgi:hypothetical protein